MVLTARPEPFSAMVLACYLKPMSCAQPRHRFTERIKYHLAGDSTPWPLARHPTAISGSCEDSPPHSKHVQVSTVRPIMQQKGFSYCQSPGSDICCTQTFSIKAEALFSWPRLEPPNKPTLAVSSATTRKSNKIKVSRLTLCSISCWAPQTGMLQIENSTNDVMIIFLQDLWVKERSSIDVFVWSAWVLFGDGEDGAIGSFIDHIYFTFELKLYEFAWVTACEADSMSPEHI